LWYIGYGTLDGAFTPQFLHAQRRKIGEKRLSSFAGSCCRSPRRARGGLTASELRDYIADDDNVARAHAFVEDAHAKIHLSICTIASRDPIVSFSGSVPQVFFYPAHPCSAFGRARALKRKGKRSGKTVPRDHCSDIERRTT
jgi:hypothetical protein